MENAPAGWMRVWRIDPNGGGLPAFGKSMHNKG
jgi:hypothetical protein